MSQPKEYSVKEPVWIDGRRIAPGTILKLTQRAARYLLADGQIALHPPKATPAKASITPAKDK